MFGKRRLYRLDQLDNAIINLSKRDDFSFLVAEYGEEEGLRRFKKDEGNIFPCQLSPKTFADLIIALFLGPSWSVSYSCGSNPKNASSQVYTEALYSIVHAYYRDLYIYKPIEAIDKNLTFDIEKTPHKIWFTNFKEEYKPSTNKTTGKLVEAIDNKVFELEKELYRLTQNKDINSLSTTELESVKEIKIRIDTLKTIL